MNRSFLSMALGAITAAFAAAAALAQGAGPSLALKPSIAAHRAIYDLTLKRSEGRAALAGVTGRMAFEIIGSACTGWTIDFRMVNEFRPMEGNVRLRDTRSTSYESGDGTKMDYSQSEFVDNRPDGEKKVSAKRDPAGLGGSGRIERPGKESFTLPAGVIFPVQHQLRLMAAAFQGESRDSSLVFDGGDGPKTYKAITFIGKRKEPGQSGVGLTAGDELKLALLPSWPVSISYYSDDKDEKKSGDVPTYQVSFGMFENGVAGSLVLDYGDFALDGKLADFHLIEQAPCG